MTGATAQPGAPRFGVVAIGRNEGERLVGCLRSLLASGAEPSRIVYVDSGSTDGSVAAARSIGVAVIELDAGAPFTAARGRNAGFAKLIRDDPELPFVQFVDGDCEVAGGWLTTAVDALAARPDVAVVCGRRRERFLDASIYNRLVDDEWDTPVGEADACGGDAMVRAAAFQQVNGYDASLIAGEDPEFCVRLRKAGWRVLRLDAEMTVHDVAMTRFGQWLRRMVRAGHGFAEIAALHGGPPMFHWRREVRSNWAWGMAVPIVSLAAAWPTRGVSLGVAAATYAALYVRILGHARRRDLPPSVARAYAFFGTLAKVPMAIGQLTYVLHRLRGGRSRIIEYKPPPVVARSS